MPQLRHAPARSISRHGATASRQPAFPTGGARGQVRHRFADGEIESPANAHYSAAVRLLLLFGATLSLWWSLYVIARVALG